MKQLIFASLVLAVVAGCSSVSSKACTDQLSACGQVVLKCTQQAGCDVSECIGSVLPTPVPSPAQ